MQFKGICISPNNVNGFQFLNNDKGLLYDENAITDFQTYAGNLWITGSSIIDAQHLGGINLAALSQFVVDGNDFNQVPSSIDPFSGWFLVQGFGQIPSCLEDDDCNPFNSFSINTSLDEAIADGTIDTLLTEDGVIWEASLALYEKVENAIDLIENNLVISSFYQEKQVDLTGDLFSIKEGINTLLKIDSVNNTMFSSHSNDFYKSFSLLSTIDSLSSSADSLQLIGYAVVKDSLLAEFLPKSVSFINSHELLFSNLSNTSFAIGISNSAIAPNQAPSSNLKQLNSVFIDQMNHRTLSVDTIQMDTIFTIAGQCPNEGGNAVYWARSMVSLLVDTSFVDSINCGNVTAQFTQQTPSKPNISYATESILEVSIYPNPGKGEIFIKLPAHDHIVEITLVSNYGNTIFTTELPKGSLSVSFKTHDILPGLYFIRVISEGELLTLKKLIILP